MDLGSWRRLSPHWQEASGISWLFARPGAFPALPRAPHGQAALFFCSPTCLHSTKAFTYFRWLRVRDLCSTEEEEAEPHLPPQNK